MKIFFYFFSIIFLTLIITFACTDNKKSQKQEGLLPYCQNIMPSDSSYIKGFLNGQPISGQLNTSSFDIGTTTAIFICEDEEQKRIGTLLIDLEKNKNIFKANIESAKFRFDNGCLVLSENYVLKGIKSQTDYINLTSELTCLKGCLNLTLHKLKKTENLPDSVIFKEIQFYKK